MASDNATINLYVNNEQAKASVKELEEAYQKLKKERKAAEDAGDIQKSLILQAQEHTALRKKNEALRGILDIEEAMAKLSVINIAQLNNIRGKLRRELSLINQGTDEFITKQKQLIKVEEHLATVQRKRNNEQKGLLANLKNLWNNIMPTISLVGAATYIGSGIKGLISDVWTLTQTMQGNAKRAATVLGDELGYVELQAEKLSKKAGLTTQEFVAMTTATADLLIPLDFSREKSARMAIEVQKLTGAMNEWTSGKYGAEDISNRLTKAMLGETESLKELGIAIRLDSEEYKNLIKQKLEAGAATTAQAQAEAILELLYKKSADAQAAYASSGNEMLRFQSASARGWRAMKESMAEWFATTKQERVEKLARTYKALNEEFVANEQTLDRLMPVYADLSSKTNLNESEQQQLRDAIDGIVQIIPHAATGLDEYGRALGVNASAVATFREAQRLLNIETKKDTIEDIDDTIEDNLTTIKRYNIELSNLKKRRADMQWNVSKNRYYDASDVDNMTQKIEDQNNKINSQYDKIAKNVSMFKAVGMTQDEINEKLKTGHDLSSQQILDVEMATKRQDIIIEQQAQKEKNQAEAAQKEKEASYGLLKQFEEKIKKAKEDLSKLQSEAEITEKNKEISALEKEYNRIQSLGVTKDRDPGKKSWSLEGDANFLNARAALKDRMLNGEIATEQEYSRLMLQLEVATLQKRIDANVEGGEELLKLRGTLSDKQLQQDKATKAERQKILELLDSGKSESERAEIEYRKQLIAYGLFTAEQLDDEQAYLERSRELNEEQYSALELLASRHRSKLSGIYNKSLTDQVDKELKAITAEANNRQIRQERELGALQTLNQKKRFLTERFGIENLTAIRTEKDADQALTDQYARENEEIVRTSLQKQIQYYTAMMVSIKAMNPMGVAMNLEELEKYKDIIAKLEEELAKIKNPEIEVEGSKADNKVDILGMTAHGWESLFNNVKNGKVGLEDILNVAEAIGQAFSQVNAMMSAMEQKEFKEFEKTQNKKKRSLETRLKSGAITQESYNTQVELLDEKTDQKREEMERKQAERAKAAAVFQAIINTASGVAAALTLAPPASFVMAGIVGALGAIQIAAILATPIPGAEDGGFVDVVRSQDGKPFRAKKDYTKRGRIAETSLLVSENGEELVVPNTGYHNPTLRPVLDMVNDSIVRGDIRTFNFDTAIAARYPKGYSDGGTTGQQPSAPVPTSPDTFATEQDTSLLTALIELERAAKKLNNQLKKPLSVSMTGRNGIIEKTKEHKSFRKTL